MSGEITVETVSEYTRTARRSRVRIWKGMHEINLSPADATDLAVKLMAAVHGLPDK